MIKRKSRAETLLDWVEPIASALIDAGCPAREAYRRGFEAIVMTMMVTGYELIIEDAIARLDPADEVAKYLRDRD